MAERRADYPIHDLFLRRWSPRAMSGEALTREELCTLFEAARWAPSSGNGQPWRFVYALAGTIEFRAFFELLAAGNRPWCAKAGVLVVVASRHQRANGQPARTHAFDTGAAWASVSNFLTLTTGSDFGISLAGTTSTALGRLKRSSTRSVRDAGASASPRKYSATRFPEVAPEVAASVWRARCTTPRK